METESMRQGYRSSGTKTRGYDIVDGQLKWGYVDKSKFEFIIGNKYKVSHENKAMILHRGAVGIYKGFRRKNDMCQAMLKCCGKRFAIAAVALIPYEGEIIEEHLKLITPIKKVHLLENGRCACKCDSAPNINPTKLCIDEFLIVPENRRCKNCNTLARKNYQA
jgi:hypothetical protein